MNKEQLRAWRKRCNMTQEEACKALGVSRSNYQNFERGTNHRKEAVTIPQPVALACELIESKL